jgi:type II secretory pathway pseudopilin PulG
MTRIQLVIVVVIAAVIAAIAVPRAVKMSRISRAEHHILTIATGFAQYRADTGRGCTKVEDLLEDPGFPGWMGPYIDKKIIRNPWGGTYGVELESQKVGIPKADKAPDQYEFGGSEEISFSFADFYSVSVSHWFDYNRLSPPIHRDIVTWNWG